MAKTKSGYLASRQNYMAQLICKRLTEKSTESYTNATIQRGTELEPVDRKMYILNQFDAVVKEVQMLGGRGGDTVGYASTGNWGQPSQIQTVPVNRPANVQPMDELPIDFDDDIPF